MPIQQTGSPPSGHAQIEAGNRASDGVDLKDVAGILARRKGFIFGFCAVFIALALTYVLIARPAYTATAQVYVDPRDRPTPKEEVAVQNSVPGDGLLLVESQLKIITSNEVLTRVVEEMGLASDPEFNGQDSLTSKIKAMVGLGSTDPAALVALRNLRLKTSAKRNDRSFVIDIMVSADTAERATRFTDAVANAYLEEQAGANSNFNRRISDSITKQLERMRDAVSQAEQSVAAYKAANNLVGARSRLVTEQELDEANTQLTNARARLSDAQARVKLIDSIVSGGARLEALPEAIQSGTIVQLRAKAADISREESQLAQINGPNHPALQAARAQVRDVQAAIKNEVNLIAQGVRNAATSEQSNVQNLQARFDSLKKLSQTNEKAIVPLRELERKAESNRAIYETFLAKAKTASEQQAIDTTNIRLISRASPPDRKSWPPTLLIMAVALFGGLTLGVAAALARDSFGARSQALAKTGGLSPEPSPRPVDTAVAVRPQDAPAGRMIQPEQLSKLTAELLAAPAGYSMLLVRASADDALDLVALELARAMEDAGKKVIVIDADLIRHPVTSRLHFDQRLGVRDVVAGQCAINDIACQLGRTSISIVPVGLAGLPSPDDRMQHALSDALTTARDFDRVIIDGGELGKTSSTYGLYAQADEVIFLASTHDSKADDVIVVADLLRHRQIKARVVFVDPAAKAIAA